MTHSQKSSDNFYEEEAELIEELHELGLDSSSLKGIYLDLDILASHFSELENLNKQIGQSSLSAASRNDIIGSLAGYSSNFHKLVESKKQLGFRENDGLRAELGENINRTLKNQEVLITYTSETIKQARINQDRVIFGGTLSLIITLVGMSLLTARSVTRSLSLITEAMEQVADGSTELNASLPENGKDETAQIARAFNRFTQKLDQTVQQILMLASNLSHSSLLGTGDHPSDKQFNRGTGGCHYPSQ